MGVRVCTLAMITILSACSTSADDPEMSVYRISDEMCGTLMVGTAVAVGDRLLVTSGHNVVGGDGVVSVTSSGGASGEAHVVEIDIHRDLALLFTESDLDPIEMADPVEGSAGTLLRRLDDGSVQRVTFTDADLVTARGHDLYNDPSDVDRATVRVQADVEPGWSGAPVIDDQSHMVGVVWAESRSTGFTYAVATEEIVSFVANASTEPVADTLECAP